MRSFIPAALLLMLLLTACAETQTPDPPPPTFTAPLPVIPTPYELPRAGELRFALIGQPQDVNVWGLFSEQGADYNTRAVMNNYWPRLYSLAPPFLLFAPRAANGLPTPVVSEGAVFTSIVQLRSDLKWTDGSQFTADDVAFTVNTVLSFELGFDWKTYYSPAYLLRAEAIDLLTVKYYFKQQPNAAVWQYGALQGPVLKKAYWQPKIAQAATLLPNDVLRQDLEQARLRVAALQTNVDILSRQISALNDQGFDSHLLTKQLEENQSDLQEASSDLSIFLERYTSQIIAAQQALYALDDLAEPTLGVWMAAERRSRQWTNRMNPALPFEVPNYDHVNYEFFDSEQAALKAFQEGWIDAVLAPDSLTLSSERLAAEQHVNLNGRARFLVFNPAKPELADPALRYALACMFWLPGRDDSAALSGFVLQGNDFWRNTDVVTPCADLTVSNPELQLGRAVQFLKSAGYRWTVEPTIESAGQGLTLPDGRSFPSILLLSLSEEFDLLQAREAARISAEANRLGIPIVVEYVTPQDVRYAVFSARNYDLAVLGWRLSLYPGYLCEWFGGQSLFAYGEGNLQSECDALSVETNLQSARSQLLEIQSILMRDLPFLPLYAEYDHEIYGDIHFPFEDVLGGFDSLYGAPSFAIPSL